MDESLADEWDGDHDLARTCSGSAEVRGSCLILHGSGGTLLAGGVTKCASLPLPRRRSTEARLVRGLSGSVRGPRRRAALAVATRRGTLDGLVAPRLSGGLLEIAELR